MKHISDEITEEILKEVKEFLAESNLKIFTQYYNKAGSVNPILEKKDFIHNVHYREGKEVRDFLRTLPDCQDWVSDDFEKCWSEIITILIEDELLIEKHKPIKKPWFSIVKKWFFRRTY